MYRMTWEERYINQIVEVKLKNGKTLQGVLMKLKDKYIVGDTEFTRDDLQYICKPCGEGN